MRRFRQIAALLLTALLLEWAPGLPPLPGLGVAPARAQNTTPSLFGLVGPAGLIWYSAASQVVSNTTAQTALISTVIPASMFATSAASNFQSVNLGPANASTPLHLRMLGLLSTTSSPGVVNLGVNFGVGTVAAGAFGPATVTLLNGGPQRISFRFLIGRKGLVRRETSQRDAVDLTAGEARLQANIPRAKG